LIRIFSVIGLQMAAATPPMFEYYFRLLPSDMAYALPDGHAADSRFSSRDPQH